MNESNQMPVAVLEPEPMPVQILAVIDRAARDPNVDVEKMERLLALSEAIHARQAKAAYDAAMNDAQMEMRPISRDCHNPQTRSRYASYEAIDTVIRPIYTKHGFAMSFGSKAGQPDRVIVTCRVSHRAGHTEMVELEMPADGKGAKGGDVMTKTHATGSALSYGKRYITNLVWNLSFGEADDDGNAAGGKPRQERPQARTADVAPQPKIATEKTKQWFLEQILPIPGCYAWAREKGILHEDQKLGDWPLESVPTSRTEVLALISEIQEWAKQKPVAPIESNEMPPEIANAVIHVSPPNLTAEQKAEYKKNPDTIGSLYRRMKDGDENARTRLWGFVHNFDATGYGGQPPTKADLELKEALIAFEKWREDRKVSEEMQKTK